MVAPVDACTLWRSNALDRQTAVYVAAIRRHLRNSSEGLVRLRPFDGLVIPPVHAVPSRHSRAWLLDEPPDLFELHPAGRVSKAVTDLTCQEAGPLPPE